ncbi:MAG TPA: hypothetical protein VJA21_31095 [Verrucomicrobiae bacterium]
MLNRGAILALLVCVVVPGCKSHPLGPYVSPRVEGQVVSAEDGRALEGVAVTRGKLTVDSLDRYPKGGQLLLRKVPAETGRDGYFVLPSERVLSVVRGSGWNEAQLSFAKNGYRTLYTNVTTTLATNSLAGEPVLSVGVVRLSH